MKKQSKVKRPTPKQLDSLLKRVCLKRDMNMCLRCGKTTNLQLSHIYPKGQYPWMRYEILNVKILCTGCHLFWWHRNPIEAYEWSVRELGAARLTTLKVLTQLKKPDRLKIDPIKIASVLYGKLT